MKFNEKLMDLRKKEGLSQEELGYKLNVTRQTVSKWELGQTTPEMDKLLEISKLFNMSVDDLINDSEIENKANSKEESNPIIEDKPINESRKNKLYIIVVLALIVVIILIVMKGFSGMTGKTKEDNKNMNIFERFFGIFDKAISMQEEMLDKGMNMQEDLLNNGNDIQVNIIENATNEINKTKFNATLELYKGSKSESLVKKLLDEIVTINKKEERKVTVKYGETETQDTEEIKNIKMNIKEDSNFEVSFEYDEDGIITEAKLERTYTEFEINRFNSKFEMSTGTKTGIATGYFLDDVITNNNTQERKIAVKYGGTETQDVSEIRNIKQKLEKWGDYEVYVEYDADRFINKVVVEKL